MRKQGLKGFDFGARTELERDNAILKQAESTIATSEIMEKRLVESVMHPRKAQRNGYQKVLSIWFKRMN